MSINIAKAKSAFASEFDHPPDTVVRAPGRVNIIGEHTDYNQGFVLPMAIENDTVITAKKRQDQLLNAYAVNLNRRVQASLESRKRNPDEPWIDYLLGIADELFKLGKPFCGADLLIIGDVPVGCGLSSSAALEMAAVRMFESFGGFSLDGAEAARLGQRVENLFLGLSTGIMDQFISRCGKAGHGLFLDCRSYHYELIPIAFPDALFVIANTCCARGLTKSKYNERVAECIEACTILKTQLRPEASHLRDFSLEDLEKCQTMIPEIPYRRARHVISENARTLQACEAMRNGDAAQLGQLMNASGDSLKSDYEVTSMELDAMTSAARALPGCFGARMTGAGFGGCTINLVAREQAQLFGEALMKEYTQRTGIKGELIYSNPADGAQIIE